MHAVASSHSLCVGTVNVHRRLCGSGEPGVCGLAFVLVICTAGFAF
jgi:hypothetical protein